ncbi:unnamed protein product [Symbiodinium sp. CCMP2592]|nr:unnamed protein product [Symbiodinium sp. CCMP2592]
MGKSSLHVYGTLAGHARRLLCGGNQDFVYGSHPSLGPVFVADTLPFDQRAANMLPGMRPLVNQELPLGFCRYRMQGFLKNCASLSEYRSLCAALDRITTFAQSDIN